MLMLCVTIPKDLTSARVKLDILEMERNALVTISYKFVFRILFVFVLIKRLNHFQLLTTRKMKQKTTVFLKIVTVGIFSF